MRKNYVRGTGFDAGSAFSSVISIPAPNIDSDLLDGQISLAVEGVSSFATIPSYDRESPIRIISHPSPAYEGGPDGAYRFYRLGYAYQATSPYMPAELVNWAFTYQEAINGTDFDDILTPGSINLPEGATIAFSIPIHAIDDSDVELAEAFKVNINFDMRDHAFVETNHVIDNDVAPPGSVTVDLTIDTLNEEYEESPGAFIAINDDFEEGERGPDTADVGTHHDIAIERLFGDNEPDRGRQHVPSGTQANNEIHSGTLLVSFASSETVVGTFGLDDSRRRPGVLGQRAGRWLPVSDTERYQSDQTESLLFEAIDEVAAAQVVRGLYAGRRYASRRPGKPDSLPGRSRYR